MKPIRALAELYGCYYGHPDSVVEVWEPADYYGPDVPPNRVGCYRCNRLVRIEWGDADDMPDPDDLQIDRIDPTVGHLTHLPFKPSEDVAYRAELGDAYAILTTSDRLRIQYVERGDDVRMSDLLDALTDAVGTSRIRFVVPRESGAFDEAWRLLTGDDRPGLDDVLDDYDRVVEDWHPESDVPCFDVEWGDR